MGEILGLLTNGSGIEDNDTDVSAMEKCNVEKMLCMKVTGRDYDIGATCMHSWGRRRIRSRSMVLQPRRGGCMSGELGDEDLASGHCHVREAA